jgi:hypothetical protein
MIPTDEWESDKLAPARGLLIGCASILAFWIVLLRLLNVI